MTRVYRKMPPKLSCMRQKTKSLGISTSLPDTGSLYVNSDIINALSAQMVENPNLSVSEAAQRLIPDIVKKFEQVNPRLILIQEKFIKTKVVRLYEQFRQYSRKQLKVDVSTRFQEKLPCLFDIIFCQCKFYR